MNHNEYPEFQLHELSYQLLLNSTNNKYRIVEVQDIDNFDEDLLLKDKDGYVCRFEVSKEGLRQARNFLNKVIKPEFIDDKDLIANNEHMYKIPQDEWDDN